MSAQPDLFGGCTLVREKGRIGRGGHVFRQEFGNEGHTVDALNRMHHRKGRRGCGGYTSSPGTSQLEGIAARMVTLWPI